MCCLFVACCLLMSAVDAVVYCVLFVVVDCGMLFVWCVLFVMAILFVVYSLWHVVCRWLLIFRMLALFVDC